MTLTPTTTITETASPSTLITTTATQTQSVTEYAPTPTATTFARFPGVRYYKVIASGGDVDGQYVGGPTAPDDAPYTFGYPGNDFLFPVNYSDAPKNQDMKEVTAGGYGDSYFVVYDRLGAGQLSPGPRQTPGLKRVKATVTFDSAGPQQQVCQLVVKAPSATGVDIAEWQCGGRWSTVDTGGCERVSMYLVPNIRE
jgi:hypothetical protein